MFGVLSAVQVVTAPVRTKFLHKSCKLASTITGNMSNDWATVKESFLNMKTEEKRKHYHCGSLFETVENIPTWVEYYQSKVPLRPKIDILGGYEVDSSKNAALAKKISMFNGDITTLEVDVIVNAANNSLMGGGGVDGAIHRAAGKYLKLECKTLNGCQAGDAKLTGAYALPAKYVIHTVGPKMEKPDVLTLCYKNCLNIMYSKQLRTIAFPCVSTGVYGYPIEKAAHVACRQVRTFLEKNHESVDRIIFCLFGAEDVIMYEKILQSYFPITN